MVAEVYLQLRELILTSDPHRHGWAPSDRLPRVWGVLVEVGLPEGPATLASLVDGTTSLYLGNGAATIGAGEAAPVADASGRLLGSVEAAIKHLSAIWEFPLPERGQVRVVALTYAGAMGGHALESEIRDAAHPLAPVYAASESLLAEIERLEASMPGPGARPDPGS